MRFNDHFGNKDFYALYYSPTADSQWVCRASSDYSNSEASALQQRGDRAQVSSFLLILRASSISEVGTSQAHARARSHSIQARRVVRGISPSSPRLAEAHVYRIRRFRESSSHPPSSLFSVSLLHLRLHLTSPTTLWCLHTQRWDTACLTMPMQ